ncbi:hypothetical protein D9M69_629190 [compost metagenome]
MKASGISAMPIIRSRRMPSCRKRIDANTAPVPQKALPSVNQSASWKSRIIEKCRDMAAGVTKDGLQGKRNRVKSSWAALGTL